VARPLPPPDVPVVEPTTGKISQTWYDYFKARDRGIGFTTGGGSSSAVWYYGTGVPSNSIGVDGDFYMRISGTTLIGVYVKQGGVW